MRLSYWVFVTVLTIFWQSYTSFCALHLGDTGSSASIGAAFFAGFGLEFFQRTSPIHVSFEHEDDESLSMKNSH